MTKRLHPALGALLILLIAGVAAAQYNNDFDGLSADPAGVVLTGQDFFYVPAGTTSVDFLVYTYAGNILGLPPNPNGGVNFVAGNGPGGTTFARAQRDVAFGDGTGMWKMEYDICATYLGTGVSANNLGSLSIRYNDANVHNIHLFSWVDYNLPTNYNAYYLAYDATGVQMAQPGTAPGPAWSGLELNHWYRCWTTLDLDANTIVEVGIIDLSTMVQSVVNPVDWYLVGGSAGAIGPPQNFRFFGGGSVAGNVMAFDNMSIAPPPPVGACCFPTGLCQILTQEMCLAQGGQFYVGVPCEPDPCHGTPVERTTWGKIKNSYR